jgi:hypothetical protein
VHWFRAVLLVPLAIVIVLAVAWAALALWIDGPGSRALAGALVAAFLSATVTLFLVVRPVGRAAGAFLILWLAVLGWWLSIPPRADRDWQPDVARVATAEVHGEQVTVHNVRDFDYRSETDYTERWDDRTYDLSQLRGVDVFVSFWGPTLIAHTIMSWEFGDGRHLAISIETRKERGEAYSALRGFFRQYELYYVVADERDVVRLRTNYRGERVFLYRLRASPALARRLLVSYLEEVDALARMPRWYNALTHNCTTTIRFHVQQSGVRNPLDWRLFVNGKADELLYERHDIDTSLPLAELRARSDITDKAKAADQDPRFSERIRDGLPPRPTT